MRTPSMEQLSSQKVSTEDSTRCKSFHNSATRSAFASGGTIGAKVPLLRQGLACYFGSFTLRWSGKQSIGLGEGGNIFFAFMPPETGSHRHNGTESLAGRPNFPCDL